MDPSRGIEPGSIKGSEAPLESDLFKFELKDMKIAEDIEAELEDFVRLARLELFEVASQWFEKCLSRHQRMFPVSVEYLDMLLQAGWYEKVMGVPDIEMQEDSGKNLAAHGETNQDGISQLLTSMKTLAKTRLEPPQEDALLAALEGCRRYLETKGPHGANEDASAIRIHLVEVYLGIVMAALEFRLITEQERVRYTNPPWTTEGAPEWSGFCAWYTDLSKKGYHWEAQRIQSILLPKVSFEKAKKTFIQTDLPKVVEDTKETEDFDESFVLSMLVMSNTVCAYLLKAAESQPHLVNLASTYLAISRSLKAELSRNSTLDIINEGRPLKRVDELKLELEQTNRTTAEAQTRTLLLRPFTLAAMGVQSYGVWRAKPVRYTYEDRHQDSVSPHLSLYFTDDEAGEGRAAINVKSGNRQESRLAYWTLSQFTHAITEKLAALNDGFQLLAGTSEQGPGGLALDFIRGNLFRRIDGRILPHDVDGPDNDILDQLKPILGRAISADATVYIYGSRFSDGRGIHNVHMNQGNSRRWAGDNGVFQDGALIFKFEDHWEAVFLGFVSQAVHTEDGPNDAGQPLPRTGYMTWADFLAPELTGEDRARHDLADSPVFITQAFVSPPGPDNQPGTAPETVTLTNRTGQGVDFSGWRIHNKAGEAQELPSGLHIAAKGTVTVEVPRAPLSNQGGTITFLNAQGLKVHGVSYTKAQAQDGTVSFRQAIMA